MKIYISGVSSYPDPQPGIGIARSIRAGFPYAHIVAVDYVSPNSGFSWHDFDDRVVFKDWGRSDLRSFIEKEIVGDSVWLSGLDIEVFTIADLFPNGRAGILVPSIQALKKSLKPPETVANILGIGVPPWQKIVEASETCISSAQVRTPFWVKGRLHGSVLVSDSSELRQAVSAVGRTWGIASEYIIQEHVQGTEVQFTFAAENGVFIDGIFMEKLEKTKSGKVWRGLVREFNREEREMLSILASQLNWTGGGELECIRDADNNLWLIEFNPRFPAWIHGASIFGVNLPAALVAKATGKPANLTRAIGARGEFGRVVTEIPIVSQPSIYPDDSRSQ